MPRVPTYDNFQVAPNVAQGGIRDTINPDAMALPGKQLTAFGDTIQNVSTQMSKVAIDALDQANQVRVDDAVDQVRRRALDLTYNPDTGYKNLKGSNALNRPEGVPLPEEYGAKLNQSINDIAGGLSNDAQKRLFAIRSRELSTSFQGDVESHMLSEFRSYHQSVAKGSEELSQQEALLNWNNPDKITQAIDGVEDPVTGQRFGGIKQSIYRQAMLSGMSAAEAQAAMNSAASGVHAKVIESALTNNDPSYAMQYFTQKKGSMTGEDILRVQGQINHQMDAKLALTAVGNTTNALQSRMMPSDMDRLMGVVIGNESGGQQFDANGQPLTSPKGAVGIAQVMPGTGPEAAQLAGLPWDEDRYKNDAQYNTALGRAYMQKQLQTFGDVGQSLAAYNVGPQATKDAIAMANADGRPETWLSYLPKETQDYVKTGSAKFAAGASTGSVPTEAEFVQNALSQLGDNPRIEAVAATRTQAEAQYKLMTESRKQQGDQALMQAQQELVANGGNFNALAPKTVSDLSRYDPGKYDDALKFAKAISKGENVTNMDAYATAVTYPDELVKMSDATFFNFLKTNFSTSDGEKIAKLRAETRDASTDDSAGAINNKAVNIALNNRLANIGINPNPNKKNTNDLARIGAIQKYVRDTIFDQQQQVGHKFSAKEVEDSIDQLFSKSVTVSGLISDNTKAMMNMEPGDVPGAARDQIKAAFASQGVTNPSQFDILRAYWTWKGKHG
jgi:soluble lytic murein transglycosylase